MLKFFDPFDHLCRSSFHNESGVLKSPTITIALSISPFNLSNLSFAIIYISIYTHTCTLYIYTHTFYLLINTLPSLYMYTYNTLLLYIFFRQKFLFEKKKHPKVSFSVSSNNFYLKKKFFLSFCHFLGLSHSIWRLPV